MADTIKEVASHRPEHIQDTKGRVHWRVGKPNLTLLVLQQIVTDAYVELGLWKALFESTDKLCQLTTDGKIGDLHELYHIVRVLQSRAYQMLKWLIHAILARAYGSPALRHLYTRHGGRHGLHDTCRHEMTVTKNATEHYLASEICYLLDELEHLELQDDPNEKLLFHVLDKLDMALRDSSNGRTMISSVVACKVAELSIATECIRQIAMWMATPEIKMSKQPGKCKVHVPDDAYPDFANWAIDSHWYTPLESAVDPSPGWLIYPIHRYPNRKNVEQMRKAEQNLDKFWDDVDSWYEEETGHAQHEYIRPYIEGEMRRTPPWIEELPSDRLNNVFVPISVHLHDKSKQITGAFESSTKVKKVKNKKHGSPEQVQSRDTITDAPMSSNISDEPEVRRVDKRTFKTLKTLFGTDTYSEGEVSKTLKWDAFVRAMIRTGFAVEKLQGSAWQFIPHGNTSVERSIQFHEPHPDSDVPYSMARRFGRRLERVYGWSRHTFQLA